MAILQLPVTSDSANYEFKTTLDDVVYSFSFRFNTRMGRWIMDVKTEDGINLVLGLPLLIGVKLLNQFADIRLPQGDLFMINLEDEFVDCGRNDLGENCLLLYNEAA